MRPRVKSVVTRSRVGMSWLRWTGSPKELIRRSPDACQVMRYYNGFVDSDD